VLVVVFGVRRVTVFAVHVVDVVAVGNALVPATRAMGVLVHLRFGVHVIDVALVVMVVVAVVGVPVVQVVDVIAVRHGHVATAFPVGMLVGTVAAVLGRRGHGDPPFRTSGMISRTRSVRPRPIGEYPACRLSNMDRAKSTER
jgi:hypothetical protein